MNRRVGIVTRFFIAPARPPAGAHGSGGGGTNAARARIAYARLLCFAGIIFHAYLAALAGGKPCCSRGRTCARHPRPRRRVTAKYFRTISVRRGLVRVRFVGTGVTRHLQQRRRLTAFVFLLGGDCRCYPGPGFDSDRSSVDSDVLSTMCVPYFSKIMKWAVCRYKSRQM